MGSWLCVWVWGAFTVAAVTNISYLSFPRKPWRFLKRLSLRCIHTQMWLTALNPCVLISYIHWGDVFRREGKLQKRREDLGDGRRIRGNGWCMGASRFIEVDFWSCLIPSFADRCLMLFHFFFFLAIPLCSQYFFFYLSASHPTLSSHHVSFFLPKCGVSIGLAVIYFSPLLSFPP